MSKILSIAPTRISLFGGGTDLQPYSTFYGGVCINIAITLRQRVTMYSGNDMFEIRGHEFPFGANPDFYYKILDEFNINDGVHLTKLHSQFDGLIESGIGSSASAAVALIGGADKRLNLNMTREQIAEKAWEIEVKRLGLYGGKQDQYAATFGGFNVMEFKDKVTVIPLTKQDIEPLLPSLVLFYTGQNRKSAVIQEGFKTLEDKQVIALDQIKKIAIGAIDPICKGDIEKVGEMLGWVWELKKESNKGVSNERIDNFYKKGLEHGALGGKILGAGGGGYMLFICPPDKREYFIKKMEKEGLQWWDFGIDWNGLEVRRLKELESE